jgi:hypothetical protein
MVVASVGSGKGPLGSAYLVPPISEHISQRLQATPYSLLISHREIWSQSILDDAPQPSIGAAWYDIDVSWPIWEVDPTVASRLTHHDQINDQSCETPVYHLSKGLQKQLLLLKSGPDLYALVDKEPRECTLDELGRDYKRFLDGGYGFGPAIF